MGPSLLRFGDEPAPVLCFPKPSVVLKARAWRGRAQPLGAELPSGLPERAVPDRPPRGPALPKGDRRAPGRSGHRLPARRADARSGQPSSASRRRVPGTSSRALWRGGHPPQISGFRGLVYVPRVSVGRAPKVVFVVRKRSLSWKVSLPVPRRCRLGRPQKPAARSAPAAATKCRRRGLERQERVSRSWGLDIQDLGTAIGYLRRPLPLCSQNLLPRPPASWKGLWWPAPPPHIPTPGSCSSLSSRVPTPGRNSVCAQPTRWCRGSQHLLPHAGVLTVSFDPAWHVGPGPVLLSAPPTLIFILNICPVQSPEARSHWPK